MLSQIIRRLDWATKYRTTFGEELADAYAAALSARGYPRATIKRIMRQGKEFMDWGRARGHDVSALDDRALIQFDKRNIRRAPSVKERVSLRCGAGHLVDFLRERGFVPPAAESPAPLAEFEDWLLTHRGAKASTVHAYVSLLQRKILPALGDSTAPLDARRLRRAVTAAISNTSVDSAKTITVAVRAFLRFEIAQGRCPAELLGAIPTVRRWKLASLPRHVDDADVDRIVAACDPQSPVGRRDRAIILLLARLAFRAGDVATLTLGSIDWRSGRVLISGKGRREYLMPLPQDVGDAILAYLRQDRPKYRTDRVFLTTRAPLRPVSAGRVSTLVAGAICRAGIKTPTRGAHLLRHSAAVRLLNREGLSLEAVAAVLRHASFDTAATYAKVDIRLLSEVVAPWPKVVRNVHDLPTNTIALQRVAAPWPSIEGGR
jgi:integrase/recombinase XerD